MDVGRTRTYSIQHIYNALGVTCDMYCRSSGLSAAKGVVNSLLILNTNEVEQFVYLYTLCLPLYTLCIPSVYPLYTLCIPLYMVTCFCVSVTVHMTVMRSLLYLTQNTATPEKTTQ